MLLITHPGGLRPRGYQSTHGTLAVRKIRRSLGPAHPAAWSVIYWCRIPRGLILIFSHLGRQLLALSVHGIRSTCNIARHLFEGAT